jgi:hypothetical protein
MSTIRFIAEEDCNTEGTDKHGASRLASTYADQKLRLHEAGVQCHNCGIHVGVTLIARLLMATLSCCGICREALRLVMQPNGVGQHNNHWLRFNEVPHCVSASLLACWRVLCMIHKCSEAPGTSRVLLRFCHILNCRYPNIDSVIYICHYTPPGNVFTTAAFAANVVPLV